MKRFMLIALLTVPLLNISAEIDPILEAKVIEYVRYEAPQYAATQMPSIWKALAAWIGISVGY